SQDNTGSGARRRRMISSRLTVLSLLPLLALGACSSSGTTSPSAPADAGAQPDAHAPTGDDTDASIAPDTGTDTGIDAGAPTACTTSSALPPSDPHGPTPTGTDLAVFAVDSWELGDDVSDGWQKLGFDIDCRTTTLAYDGCTPAAGGQKSHLVDGT